MKVLPIKHEVNCKDKVYKRANNVNTNEKFKYKYDDKLFGIIFLKNHSLNIYSILFFSIIFIILIPQIYSIKKLTFRLSYENAVKLKIKGSAWHKVISEQRDEEIPLPDRIKINNDPIIYNPTDIWQICNSEINSVRIAWDNKLTTCKNMFKGVWDLIDIDFSEFDFSKVTDMTSLCDWCENVSSINMNNGNGLQIKSMDWMFAHCHNLETIDLSGFKTSSELISMSGIFFDNNKLKSIDLSNFVTTSVTSMFQMFVSCISIKSLDLSNFCTPALTNMEELFFDCQSLEYLNISCFNTSKIENMVILFKNCYNLKYIDLRNFDTSVVTEMAEMFMNCYRLTSIELSSFNTESVWNMGHMFAECNSLVSLNLSNFNTKAINYIDYMFYNCYSLKYLDVTSFDTNGVTNFENVFFNASSLISLNFSNFNISESSNVNGTISQMNRNILLCYGETKVPDAFIEQLRSYNNNCSLMCDKQGKIFIDEIKKCVISCYTSETKYIYQYERKCYLECPEGTKFYNDTKLCEDCRDFYTLDKKGCLDSIPYGYYNDDIDAKTIKKCPNECQNCSLDSVNLGLCLSCNANGQYYPKINDSLNIGSYFKCYNKDELQTDYYLDNNIFKPCYFLCNKCSGEGNNENNNCIECKDADNEVVDGNCICINYYNYEKTACISIIPDGYYNNDFAARTIDKCPSIINNDLCISCNIINGYYPKEGDPNNINSYYECYQEDQPYYYLDYKNNIFKPCYFLCKTCSGEGNDEHNLCMECNNATLKVVEGNCIYILDSISEIVELDTDITTYKNSNKSELIRDLINEIINRSNISELKELNIKENISENLFLEFGLLNYDNFNKKKDLNEITINLGQCENILKNIHNISYNNSLYIMKYILIVDGMKIPKVEYEVYYPFFNQSFIKLNLEPCKNTKIEISIPVSIEDDIDKYNPDSKYYNDMCSKATSNNGTDITLNDRKNEYINNNMTLCEEDCRLIDYNYETEKVKCSCDIKLSLPLFEEIRFNKDLLYKRFTDINNIINIQLMKCYKYVFNKSIIRNCGFFILLSIIILFFICLIIFLSKSYNKLKIDINDIVSVLNNKTNYIYKKKKLIRKNAKNKFQKSESKLNYLNINKENNLNTTENSKKNNLKNSSKNIITNSISQNNKKIIEYNDFELNSMEYNKARKFDQRSYIQIYISLLKIKNLFIFSFWPFKDYNSRIIKMFLFFFFFAIHFTFNALFFNDPTIHKIYEDKGSYNFIYQIPQILYSSLISGVANVIIKLLSLSQSDIIELKQYKSNKNFDIKRKELLQKLNIKFISFFIITFISLLFSLFYISCFCGIYENTQIQFIKDTIFSFLVSLLSPFWICLIPGILRIISLRNKKGTLGHIYKLSLVFH